MVLASVEALVIIVLGAIIIEPYIANRPQTTASSQGMDPSMMQKQFELPTNTPVPSVSFTITKDVVGGYDLHVVTTNFIFTPQLINQAPVADQGHAHLYVDGTLTILLAPWYHIASLTPGPHTLMVSLNANDHSVFAANGQPIQSMQTIVVPPVE